MGEKQDLTLEQLQGQLHNLEERMSAHEKEYAGSFISLELAVLGVIRAIVRTQKERQFLENALQELFEYRQRTLQG